MLIVSPTDSSEDAFDSPRKGACHHARRVSGINSAASEGAAEAAAYSAAALILRNTGSQPAPATKRSACSANSDFLSFSSAGA